MAHRVTDRVGAYANTVGAGNHTLTGAAIHKFQLVAASLTSNSDTGFFFAEAAGQWEVFLGTRVDATTLARTAVYASSNAGAAVSWDSGLTIEIVGCIPARFLELLNTIEIAVASAATCDIGAVQRMRIRVTGTTGITSFGTAAHKLRFLRFDDQVAITHNATSLFCPGGATFSTVPGATAIVMSDGSGNWRFWHYMGGALVVGGASATTNAFARYDGNTGKFIKNSGVLCDDSNNLTGIAALTASGNLKTTGACEFGSALTGQTSITSGGIMTVRSDSAGIPVPLLIQNLGATPSANQGATIRFSFGTGGGSATTVGEMATLLTAANLNNSKYRFNNLISSVVTFQFDIGDGCVVGNASGGFKGNGTLNAVGVYDDNTLLTCAPLQRSFIRDGIVDVAFFDSIAPDLQIEELVVDDVEIPEERALVPRTELMPVYDQDGVTGVDAIAVPVYEEVEEDGFDILLNDDGDYIRVPVRRKAQRPVLDEVVTREKQVIKGSTSPARTIERSHRAVHRFAAMVAEGFDPRDAEQYFERLLADEACPGMPTKKDWVHGSYSVGETHNNLALALDMLALATRHILERLKVLEAAAGARRA